MTVPQSCSLRFPSISSLVDAPEQRRLTMTWPRAPLRTAHRQVHGMKALGVVVVVLVVVSLLVLAMAVRIVKQYENGVLFRLGRVIGEREPGLRLIIPLVDVLHRISLRIVTMPIQSHGIITRDNVSVDGSAVAY